MKPHIHNYMNFVRKALARIQYRDWKLKTWRHFGKVFIYVEFMAKDASNPADETLYLQRGRDFYIGDIEEAIHADKIIGTAYLAIKTAEEHERDEFFKVDGISLNTPHMSTAARQEAYYHTFPDVVGKGTLAK
jgi:hypothetical protein